jgi:hypothetical protein
MNKVVYRSELGVYILSKKAVSLGKELLPQFDWSNYEILPRHHPVLVQIVETLGEDAGYDLCIKEIDEDSYYIYSYDGKETVLTPKSTPWIKI